MYIIRYDTLLHYAFCNDNIVIGTGATAPLPPQIIYFK